MPRPAPASRAAVSAWLCSVLLCGARSGNAQSATSELWPEIDVYWSPRERLRLQGVASVTRNDESRYREGSAGLHVDYVWQRGRYVRVGYVRTESLSDTTYREDRIVTDLTLTTPGELFRFVNRARGELRWIGNDQAVRLRDRVRVEREIPRVLQRKIVPYLSEELFYDSRYRTISRNRLQLGAEIHVSSSTVLDLAYIRQSDTRATARHVHIASATLSLYFY